MMMLKQVARVLEQVTVNGIEIPEHGSGSELLFFLLNKKQAKINENETKTNNRTKNKINERLITNKCTTNNE
jgi:hypothetical protein